ncbi:hypothetical protein PRO82_001853 [Candidatus Protochlamydia amoebophila]|nr:hypothetical protein [Candidatus Protochlamydia amoebophila]
MPQFIISMRFSQIGFDIFLDMSFSVNALISKFSLLSFIKVIFH